MNTELLERARQAKQRQDSQQQLVDMLPELEAQAKAQAQQVQIEQNRSLAQQMFNEALEQYRVFDHETDYEALRDMFRAFVETLKSDNRSQANLWDNALRLGYFLAAEDTLFGLTADNQQRHAEQLMIDADVQSVTLPQPKDVIDDIFNLAIQEAIKTV